MVDMVDPLVLNLLFTEFHSANPDRSKKDGGR